MIRGLETQGAVSALVDAPFGFPRGGRFVLEGNVDKALLDVYGSVNPSALLVHTIRLDFAIFHRRLVKKFREKARDVLSNVGARRRELALVLDMTWTKTVGPKADVLGHILHQNDRLFYRAYDSGVTCGIDPSPPSPCSSSSKHAETGFIGYAGTPGTIGGSIGRSWSWRGLVET